MISATERERKGFLEEKRVAMLCGRPASSGEGLSDLAQLRRGTDRRPAGSSSSSSPWLVVLSISNVKLPVRNACRPVSVKDSFQRQSGRRRVQSLAPRSACYKIPTQPSFLAHFLFTFRLFYPLIETWTLDKPVSFCSPASSKLAAAAEDRRVCRQFPRRNDNDGARRAVEHLLPNEILIASAQPCGPRITTFPPLAPPSIIICWELIGSRCFTFRGKQKKKFEKFSRRLFVWLLGILFRPSFLFLFLL